MYTIIGKERKTGIYEGNVYDNTLLHCSYDKKNCEGVAVVTFKVKTANLCDVTIGQVIMPFFDRYGNVIEVR